MDGRATDQQLQGSQGQAWDQASAEHLRLRSNGVTAGAAPSERYSSDPEKAFVMKAIARLVRQGCAELAVLESGKTRLRLKTGEVFHLGEQAITRIA